MGWSGGGSGSQGPQGDVGAQGAQGFQGNQGTQGFQGNQGNQGTQGFQGNQGNQGFQGVAGAAGAQGFQGVAGAQGAAGSNTWPMLLATNVIAESGYRATEINNNNPLASGTLQMRQLWIPTGKVIGHLGLFTGGTAAVAPTHSWAGLFDNNRNLLAVSADAGAAAIGSTAALSYAIATIASGAASSFTTTYEGVYYVGWLITATTPPTVYGPTSQAFGTGPSTGAVALGGASSSGLTTPPAFPFQAAAVTASTILAYMNVAA